MNNKEKFGRLAVGTQGDLVKTNEIDINRLTSLASLKGKVVEGRIVLQLLPSKETKIGGRQCLLILKNRELKK